MKSYFYLIFLMVLTSCINTKRFGEVLLQKDNTFYQKTHFGSMSSDTLVLVQTRLKKNVKASITDDSKVKKIIIDKQYDSTTFLKKDTLLIVLKTGNTHAEKPYTFLTRSFYNSIRSKNSFMQYPSLFIDDDSSKWNTSEQKLFQDWIDAQEVDEGYRIVSSKPLKYISMQPMFQAVTVPFKYRRELNDEVGPQLSTGFNAGIAGGYTFKWNKYKVFFKDQNKLKDQTKTFSLSLGLFGGPTVISFEKGKTVKSDYTKWDRNVLGVTYGALVVVGIDKFSLGIAGGIDKATGNDRNAWIYQDSGGWVGFVFGLGFLN
ncbi:hypothetical protein [Marinoscillum sp.]|uniref:hypothetical protein n=1 Tax=Marinoscillum sp. TaxID=2024838 RepID=UPI003BA8F5DE